MKTHIRLLWTVTLFMTAYFCQPGLLLRACVPNPTNCLSQAMSVDKAIIVQPVNESQSPPRKDVIAPLIFFVIVLAAFAYIIYQIIKMLDKIIPPPEKAPDPPPHTGDTNHPPVVINPSHGLGPATVSLNHLTVTSNTPSWGTITSYNIRDLKYQDNEEKFPTVAFYDTFWSTEMQFTTNMVEWRDSHYRVDCYVNSTYGAVMYAYYHFNTNWWNCYYTTDYIASNHMAPAWFDLSDNPKVPSQFFRLNPK